VESYPFKSIELKWRQRWEDEKTYRTDLNDVERKLYVLVMYSYPSEKKLHIGHWWNYGPTDTFARFRRMQGYNVFEPMGFDAFGLPAENYAIKHGVHPAVTTRESVGYIREQLKQIGAMYDWSKEIDTSRPEYYRWTQWLFLQLFHNGAAYRKRAPVNWCPKCATVLANEQVTAGGTCERCDTKVTTRDLEQWFFRITDFADQLLEGLERIDWPEATKAVQRHWIGRSEGTEIIFKVDGHREEIRTFTTRPDTLFGVTYIVLAPENELVERITTPQCREEVERYVSSTREKSEIERITLDKAKEGVFTGAYALNPANGDRVPIWIADYVLETYGTGAVMAVPAHDQRDFDFAARYGLDVKWVIRPKNPHDKPFVDRAFEEYGVMHDSGPFDGLTSEQGITAVTRWLEERGSGGAAVSYRLRDWLVSRQRYWGAPIPIIYCPACGLVPVPEDQLPVMLPEEIENFTPMGTSPLGACEEFIKTTCPQCGIPARRDPDTMDTFVDSSWYFLRYPSADIHDKPWDEDLTRKWLPVDVYVGGPEHSSGHLIYARYITKFLNSIGRIDFDEPCIRLVHQGIITYRGQRMSKSKGNVVNPDKLIDQYGADCFRLYLMFMGDYVVGGDWTDEGIIGIRRFQNRIWRLINTWAAKMRSVAVGQPETVDRKVERTLNSTIKAVTFDLERFQFNTAISRLMELVNRLYLYTNRSEEVNLPFLKRVIETMTLLLGPFAPHMGEEMWEMLGHEGSLFDQPWPKWDEQVLKEEQVTIVVQVNGKLSGRIEAPQGIDEQSAVVRAMAIAKVKRCISGKKVKRVVFIQDKVVNIVI